MNYWIVLIKEKSKDPEVYSIRSTFKGMTDNIKKMIFHYVHLDNIDNDDSKLPQEISINIKKEAIHTEVLTYKCDKIIIDAYCCPYIPYLKDKRPELFGIV